MGNSIKLKPILDNGHGGLIGGEYQTPGKRSPEWEYGVLYEGVFNRWVVNRIKEELARLRIPYYHISDTEEDIHLRERVKNANNIYRIEDNKAYILSIHANAGGGEGIEIFTSYGETLSDKIATKFLDKFENSIAKKYNMNMRYDWSDNDKDKEAAFYMLNRTLNPAILVECGFMDNRKDYKLLWDREWIKDLVNDFVSVIKDLYINGLQIKA